MQRSSLSRNTSREPGRLESAQPGSWHLSLPLYIRCFVQNAEASEFHRTLKGKTKNWFSFPLRKKGEEGIGVSQRYSRLGVKRGTVKPHLLKCPLGLARQKRPLSGKTVLAATTGDRR